MPRRYRRYSRKSRDKYSVEQYNFTSPPAEDWTLVESTSELTQNSRQWYTIVVPPVNFQGMRKVKHLTISLCNVTSDNTFLIYNLVYVPEGYQPLPINFPANGSAVSNYASNQFIMSSGVIDLGAGPTRIRSPLSRNLNSGDAIYLVLSTNADVQTSFRILGQLSYALTLQ